MVQDRQADGVLAFPADVLLEPGDGFEVVVEDLGLAGEDDIDGVGVAVEVGGQDLDGGSGPLPDGQDAAAEVVGAAVGEVVAGDGGDDDVLQAEPGQASARRSGSSRATASGLPRLTAQKPQGRVQVCRGP